MNSPKISVIVPVYNVEKYLRRCIDSILAQTFTGFELLLIDDGSKDKSGEICDEYAKKDSRVRVFHKENGGVSSARNLGLDNALGEWITFVDSDDYVNTNWLSFYVQAFDADLIIQGCKIVESNVSMTVVMDCDILANGNTRFDILCSLVRKGLLNSPWNKCYKYEIIKKNDLRFVEGVSLSEDLIFVLDFLSLSNSLHIERCATYVYNRQSSILSFKFYEPLSLVEWKYRIFYSAIRLVNWNFDNEFFRTLITKEFSWLCFYVVPNFSKTLYNERLCIYSYMRTMYFVVRFRDMSFNRIPFILLPINLRLFDGIVKWYSFFIYKIVKRVINNRK